VPFVSTKPPPPPKESLDDAEFLPEATANMLDLLTFGWLTDLMSLGYKRTLEATDLYKLSPDRGAARIADEINASFDCRQEKAMEYNRRLANGELQPGLWRNIIWTVKGNAKERERKWREIDGRKKASLTWAINDSVKWWFWSGGLLKVIGDIAQVCSPLVVKVRPIFPSSRRICRFPLAGYNHFCFRILQCASPWPPYAWGWQRNRPLLCTFGTSGHLFTMLTPLFISCNDHWSPRA
jgi:hypothetical protein